MWNLEECTWNLIAFFLPVSRGLTGRIKHSKRMGKMVGLGKEKSFFAFHWHGKGKMGNKSEKKKYLSNHAFCIENRSLKGFWKATVSNSIPKNQIFICVQPSPLNVTQSASMHFQWIGSQSSVTDEKREKKLKWIWKPFDEQQMQNVCLSSFNNI